jgi:hypothetical protein
MSVRTLRRGCVADAYTAASGLSIVSYTESASGFGLNTGTTRTVTGLSVVSGDMLVFLGAQEDVSGTFSAPTATGVTFTSRQVNATANNCRSNAYTAPIVSTNASLTVSATVPSGKYSGFGLFLVRGGVFGTSSKETNTSEAPDLTITTTKANSVLLYLQADWNAGDGTSRTWRTVNSIVGTERTYFRNSAAYTVYAGSWSDSGAIGAKSVGLSAPVGQQTSHVAVEIKSV